MSKIESIKKAALITGATAPLVMGVSAAQARTINGAASINNQPKKAAPEYHNNANNPESAIKRMAREIVKDSVVNGKVGNERTSHVDLTGNKVADETVTYATKNGHTDLNDPVLLDISVTKRDVNKTKAINRQPVVDASYYKGMNGTWSSDVETSQGASYSMVGQVGQKVMSVTSGTVSATGGTPKSSVGSATMERYDPKGANALLKEELDIGNTLLNAVNTGNGNAIVPGDFEPGQPTSNK